ncbi:MAG: hypothetical protein AABZ08_11565 [Planctomycetota bacterium]
MTTQTKPVQPTSNTRSNRQNLLFNILLVASILYGCIAAYQNRWVCDDAFISYRYALNLVEGKGLVFNAGERVEGYSNFLWTLWCAVPLQLGIRCETWTIYWGIICYAASIWMMGTLARLVSAKVSPATTVVPVAAILAAVHEDWNVFATSGLETSLFTMLAVAGFVLFARGEIEGRHRPITTGIVITLASLTRPDGVIFAVVLGGAYLALGRPRWRTTILYVLAFGIPHAAFLAWRVWYYGDIFPNTYYAKSGNLAWWGQGWAYLMLYLQKYWATSLGVIGFMLCMFVRDGDSQLRNTDQKLRRLAIVAAGMAGAYMLYIVRVGGDFMFARMLIPATPFLLILIELGMMRLPLPGLLVRTVATAAICIALVLPRYPMTQFEFVSGVVNEHLFYGTQLLDAERDNRSAVLRKYFADVPVCIAFLGAEAHAMYRGRIATAIESEAGLTDQLVAHQAVSGRGRVGHEKNATLDYLIRQRKTHFTFHSSAVEILKLPQQLVSIRVSLDGLPGFVLMWDPAMVAEVRRRGGEIEDLPTKIDEWIGQLTQASDAEVSDLYKKLRLMYFEHVSDPTREAPFLKRLKRVP